MSLSLKDREGEKEGHDGERKEQTQETGGAMISI